MRSRPHQVLLPVLSAVAGPAGVWTAFLKDPKPLHLWESADRLGRRRHPVGGSSPAARHGTGFQYPYTAFALTDFAVLSLFPDIELEW